MNNKNIKYICFYDTEKHSEEYRLQSPAAHQKVDFISTLLNELGYKVEIISASQTTTNKTFPAREETLSDNKSLRLFKTIGRSGIISKIKRKLFGYNDFKKYLNRNIKNGDTVIVYHSIEYLNSIIRLKRKRRIKLIVEFEELYSDIKHYSNRIRNKEMLLAKTADALIMPTYTMNSLINLKNVPSIILHGDYLCSNLSHKKNIKSEVVKVIYTGTLNPNTGGANNAIRAAKFLPKNYELNIVGYGTKKQVEDTMMLCKELQAISKCKINYLGTFTNSECEQLIRESDIGLSTRNSSGVYNSTSFPSKILAYLKNGAMVVSCNNDSIKSSDVADLLFFYEGDNPSKIAEAIIAASNSKQSKTERLFRLKVLYNKALINLNNLLKEDN